MKRYRQTIFSILLAMAVTVAMIPVAALTASAAWGGGTALPSMNTDGYYLIDTEEKLAWFSARVNSGYTTIKAKQTANLDMGSRPFTPIGSATHKFLGIYNGGGYTIANLKVTGDTEAHGLFGYIATTVETVTLHDVDNDGNQLSTTYTEKHYTPAEVNNVTLTAASVSGSTNVGGIAGISEGGKIFGCAVAGTVTASASNAGGIVGYNISGGSVINCQNDATVSGTLRVGGIAGYCYSQAIVYGCCNAGSVNGTKRVGGVAGHCTACEVHHSYNKGVVTATENSCGGIIGYDMNSELYCMYSIGSVSCPGEYTGAVLGNKTYNTRVAKLYYDRSDTTATDSYATAAEHELMLDASFLTSLNFSLEIYVGDYFHTNNGYPILRWQLIGWDGSVGEPETNSSGVYLITSGNELAWFAGLVNGTLTGVAQNRSAKAQVMRDILLNPGIFDDDSKVWTPIGTESSPFTGTFDGGEHRISGVYLPDKNANYSGLFGSVGAGGTVKNIFLESSLICGKNYSGAIAGAVLANGLIENCFNYSTVQSQYYTGGIAGMSAGTIRTCGNVGNVVGEYYSGGITGANNNGSVTSCFNHGKVTGVSRTGGILGTNYGVIRSCYNNGIVEGGVSVGGLVAYQNSSAENGFTACYNIGYVKGTQNVGAVVGYMQNGTLTYCYYDTERSGAGDNALGTVGKTSAQMAEPTSITAFDGFSSAEWVDRGSADTYFDYCPELKVFYNSNNTLLRTTSKESAAVVKRSFTVMTEVDGEMNTYYASVKLGVQHIGTHEGTLTVIRDTSIVETTMVNGNVTITDNAQTRTLTRGTAFTGSFFTVNGMLTLAGTGTDTLRLNGGGMSVSGLAPVNIASTGRVTIEKGALITANHAVGNGGGVYVGGGELTMKGGRIAGNDATRGGGVYNADGVLTMSGGTIADNTAQNGAGLYLQGTDAEVTLSGTAVSGNTASQNGGGVYVQNGAADWTGGTLTGNTAEQGGGAYIAGTLRLSGGSVTGNTATAGAGVYQAGTLELSGKCLLASSDDVYLPSGKTVTNTDRISTSGTVANLTVADYAVGTRVLDGEFCAANYAKYIVNVPAGSEELFVNSTGYLVAREMHNVARVSMFGAYSVYYTSLKEAVEAIGSEAGMITMVDNDNIEETINVQGNIIVTIVGDENASRTLTRYRTCTGAMFNVAEGATLEFGATGMANNASLVVDGGSALYGTYGTCIVENHGTVRVKDGATLQNASSSGDGAAIRNSGTLEIVGGLINNCTSANGGAVWNEGTAAMTGGTIRNCSAQNGGAVYNTGSLAFNGGTITANTASQNGGGICSASGSADMTGGVLETVVTQIVDGQEEPVLDANGNPTVIETVVSGTLSGNTARYGGGMHIVSGAGSLESGVITDNTSTCGGGIYLAGGSYTVKGGSITANTASAHGTAVYNSGSLTLESAQIGQNSDVYLVTGHTVIPAGTAPSALLTPQSYTIGTPMLSGDNVSALHGGFTVANERYFINAAGLLDTTTISLKESSNMQVDYTKGFITGIDVEHRTVDEILAQFDNDSSSLILRNRKGAVISGSDMVSTGCVITLQDGAGHTIDSKTFVVVGDVNGDGGINGVDASHVYYFLAGMLDKNSSANAADYRAADADNDGTVDETDADLLRACGMYKGSVVQP